MSHPSRGAWIEITGVAITVLRAMGRTPRGVRGLKSAFVLDYIVQRDVAPLAGCVD